MINENKFIKPQVSRYICDIKTKEINSRRYLDLRSKILISGDIFIKQKVTAVNITLNLFNYYRRPK